MAVTVYKSTDGSAPVLTGTAGEFVNLLDKCLVAGYGAKSAAGWTKPFTGTNKAAFRPASGGNQYYLRVLDHNLTGSTRYALFRGYVTMSDVDTGTEPFPTVAQSSTDGNGLPYNTNSIVRDWIVVADGLTANVFVNYAGTGYQGMVFGDFYSYVAADAYRTISIGESAIGTDVLSVIQTSLSTVSTGHYVPRAYTGTGTSLQVGKHGDYSRSFGSGTTLGTIQYPNGPSGGAHLSPLWIHETASPLVRGKLRGLYHWMHSNSGVGTGDTMVGTSTFAGKNFLLIACTNSSLYCVETSNTWATSS